METDTSKLEILTVGDIPIGEDGTFDLSKINSALSNPEIGRKDLLVELRYAPDTGCYSFTAYGGEF